MSKQLSVVEATRQLGISLDATYKLIYARKLAARKANGRWRIPISAVEKRLRAKTGIAVGRRIAPDYTSPVVR
jgi:excisionase family DNA binding protein